MAQSLAQNAIALLIDLAEQGEIDPWDVQVIDVIDRFLSGLTSLKQEGMAAYEVGLSESGQAFLYASMLVLLKADNLARSDVPAQPDALGEEELLEADQAISSLPANLEQTLRRRATAQPPQQRRVTLQELIEQLKLIESTIDQQSPRTRLRRSKPQPKSQAVRAIAQLAHQENLSEVAVELEQFLTHHWRHISQNDEWIEFDLLLGYWFQFKGQGLDQALPGLAFFPLNPQQATAQVTPKERVSVFWALLFLSAQSKVELFQEEFYQALKVRVITDGVACAVPE